MVADVRLQVYKIDGVEILYLYVLITKSKDKFPKMQFVNQTCTHVTQVTCGEGQFWKTMLLKRAKNNI